MRTEKNQTMPFPLPVEAVNEFYQLIGAYFECNSLTGINTTLLDLIGAATTRNLLAEEHKPMAIAAMLYDVRNTVNLITKTRGLLSKRSFHRYAKNLAFKLLAVTQFEVDYLADLLYAALDRYIAPNESACIASLAFSFEITAAFKMIYDWLAACNNWYNALSIKPNGG